jgi:hypothetical protein
VKTKSEFIYDWCYFNENWLDVLSRLMTIYVQGKRPLISVWSRIIRLYYASIHEFRMNSSIKSFIDILNRYICALDDTYHLNINNLKWNEFTYIFEKMVAIIIHHMSIDNNDII